MKQTIKNKKKTCRKRQYQKYAIENENKTISTFYH